MHVFFVLFSVGSREVCHACFFCVCVLFSAGSHEVCDACFVMLVHVRFVTPVLLYWFQLVHMRFVIPVLLCKFM